MNPDDRYQDFLLAAIGALVARIREEERIEEGMPVVLTYKELEEAHVPTGKWEDLQAIFKIYLTGQKSNWTVPRKQVVKLKPEESQ